MKTYKKVLIKLHFVFTLFLILLVWPFYFSDHSPQHLISVSWGDGFLGKASYGVYLYANPTGKGDEVYVSGRIYIGREASVLKPIYKIKKIGTAENFAAAVKKWGTVTWQEKEVVFGEKGKEAYVIPKEKFQSWR